MSVITINTEISFSIDDIDDADIDSEFRKRDHLLDKLKLEWEDELDDPSPYDFSTSELMEVLENRGEDLRPWIEHAYRLIAEGKNDEAMELIYAECSEGLAPPNTEKRTAALLAGKETSTNVRN